MLAPGGILVVDGEDELVVRTRRCLDEEWTVDAVDDARAAIEAMDADTAVVLVRSPAEDWSAAIGSSLRDVQPHCRIAQVTEDDPGPLADDAEIDRLAGVDQVVAVPRGEDAMREQIRALGRRAEYSAISTALFATARESDPERDELDQTATDGEESPGVPDAALSADLVDLRRRADELAGQLGDDDYRALFAELDVSPTTERGALDA